MPSKNRFWAGGFCLLATLSVGLLGWQQGASQSRTEGNRGGKLPIKTAADSRAAAKSPARRPAGGDIEPETTVWDPFPTFNGIALDTVNNRVAMTDLNRHSILIYDRTAAANSAGEPSTPLRHIIGPATEMGFVAGIAMDPEKHEVFAAENDAWGIRVFSYDDEGNARPRRLLATPHQLWGLSLSRARHEMAASVEELDAVVVYRQEADQLEAPLRVIRGEKTGLADDLEVIRQY